MRGGAAFRASARREHWLPPRWAEPRVQRVGAMVERATAFPDWPDAPAPDMDFEHPAGVANEAGDGFGLNGSAPEGTSGALAGVETYAANADQTRSDFDTDAAGERQLPPAVLAASPVAVAPKNSFGSGRGTEPEPCAAGKCPPFPPAAQAPSVPANAPAGTGGTDFAGEIRKAPKIDFARVAAAARSRALPAPAKAEAHAPFAHGREWCAGCAREMTRGQVGRCERMACPLAEVAL